MMNKKRPKKKIFKLPKKLGDQKLYVMTKNNYRNSYIICDKNGEVLDNAQGWGYKSTNTIVGFLRSKYHRNLNDFLVIKTQRKSDAVELGKKQEAR